jgi:L-amino acid N-acyltransferase YncA
MIIYTTSNATTDLEGILSLQKANLAQSLTPGEILSQGFLTVDHSLALLKKLNDYEKHVIAKDHDKVIGYVLAMTKQSKFDIPILFPMFNVFDAILYKGKKISGYNYIIIGQVCIEKKYRGQGIFDNCYAAYKAYYFDKYDFAITEIAKTNLRSLNAHKRIGFIEIHSYVGPDQTEWIVVIWNWKNDK